MTIVNMEITQLDSWKTVWREHYDFQLESILTNETVGMDWKKVGVAFLNSIDKNMNEILNDFFQIRLLFDEVNRENLMFNGVSNILNGFKLSQCFAHDEGIVKFFNENQQLIFDPFVLESEMMAEFVAVTDDEHYFFLNIRIYEYDSNRIDFDFEYQTPEDKEKFAQFQASIKNGPLNVNDFEINEDDEDQEVSVEALRKLAELKFTQLKNALRWQKDFESIELQKCGEEDDEICYLIQIYDKSISMTTISCTKTGWNIQWGSSITASLKAVIEKVMNT